MVVHGHNQRKYVCYVSFAIHIDSASVSKSIMAATNVFIIADIYLLPLLYAQM
jgi:hypothetical protein